MTSLFYEGGEVFIDVLIEIVDNALLLFQVVVKWFEGVVLIEVYGSVSA